MVSASGDYINQFPYNDITADNGSPCCSQCGCCHIEELATSNVGICGSQQYDEHEQIFAHELWSCRGNMGASWAQGKGGAILAIELARDGVEYLHLKIGNAGQLQMGWRGDQSTQRGSPIN